MPATIAPRQIDEILGTGLLATEAVARKLRAEVGRALVRRGLSAPWPELIRTARDVIANYEPILAEALRNTELAAWIAGLEEVAKKVPSYALQTPGSFFPPPGGPRWTLGDLYGDDEPQLRFPIIEEAGKDMLRRGIVSAADYRTMAQDLRNQSFSVAGDLSREALEDIQAELTDAIKEGTTLREFRSRLDERIGTSRLGEGHIENVFRTNIQTAYSNGHETLAANPIVAELFPYQEYLAIRDARARETHLALETLGLSGTAVYRRDDPMWNYFTPPWDYQCRCSVNLLTVEAAARKGVFEAQEWLRTGRPPENPEHRIEFIPFRPRVGFGGRNKRVAA